jgi:hypothetical protein
VKHGPTLGWIRDADQTFELERQSGSLGISLFGLDIGSFEETVTLGRFRWFTGNSFHWSLGAGERRYRLSLGDETLDQVASAVGASARYDVVAVRNWVAAFGLGNRWQLAPGFVVGVDWLDVLVPVGQGEARSRLYDELPDGAVRRGLHRAFGALRYGPTFEVLRLQLGWAF